MEDDFSILGADDGHLGKRRIFRYRFFDGSLILVNDYTLQDMFIIDKQPVQ